MSVQLMLVNILSARVADPHAREALDSVANSDADSDRPELVRMAARRVLNGGAGWSEYLVTTMQDPQTSDAERIELISYAYKLRMLPDAPVRLDEAGERSLASMVTQGSPKVALAAIGFLTMAGGSVSRKEFIDLLRSGIGQSRTDSEIRRAALTALAFTLRLHPENRSLFEEIRARDQDPALREAAEQALDQTK